MFVFFVQAEDGIRVSLFFFQAEDGIRVFCLSRGLGDVYNSQIVGFVEGPAAHVRLEELTGHGAPGGSACAVPHAVSYTH